MDSSPLPPITVERIQVQTLIPYANNARTHSPQQVAQIASSIKEFGFNNPVLVDGENGIIAGHGRILAAQKLGLQEVPCIRLTHLTDSQRRAFILADNRIALSSGWDEDMLKLELGRLGEEGADLGVTGFSKDEIKDLRIGGEEEEDRYTKKIEAPIYTPQGEKPPITDLYDDRKAQALIAEIRAANLPPDIAAFLELAAARHTVFEFKNIAEFYAHADANIQELMEKSALVIIDFDQAIENGFVRMTKNMLHLVGSEAEDAG